MKKYFGAMMGACLLTACANITAWNDSNDEKVTKQLKAKEFEQIDLRGSMAVYYGQGDSLSIVMEGTRDQLENITIDISGKTLRISEEALTRLGVKWHGQREQAKICVTSPDLTAVTLNGSGDFVANGTVDTDTMRLTLKGSGDVRFDDIVCDRIVAELIGSGDVKLKQAETQTATLSVVGSGDLSVRLKNTTDTQVDLLGSGDIDIHFDNCRRADCRLRGSGDIEMKGNLAHLSQQKSGSGDIDTHHLTLK